MKWIVVLMVCLIYLNFVEASFTCRAGNYIMTSQASYCTEATCFGVILLCKDLCQSSKLYLCGICFGFGRLF